jgi:mannose-6-phosphate isomerase
MRLAARFAAVPALERDPGEEPFGEAWLVGPEARVLGGPQAGWSIAELTARFGEALLGVAPTRHYGTRFPLLIKLLDAAEPLSIQVHPDDAYAVAHASAAGDLGKTEAWWLLDATSDATLWWGVNAPVTRQQLREAAEGGNLPGLLRRMPARKGEVFVNPAGTIHALGAGIFAYEVQQASDLTYRLDDHGRFDAVGRPRALHLEDGVAVATLTPSDRPAPPAIKHPGRMELARTHAFVLERLHPSTAQGLHISLSDASFEVLTNLGEEGTAELSGQSILTLPPQSSWLFAAGSGKLVLGGGGPYARARYPMRSSG